MTSVLNYLPAKLNNTTLLYSTGVTLLTVPPVAYFLSGLYTSRRRHNRLFSRKELKGESSRDAKSSIASMEKDYDLIIVGAGVIGSALASVVAEKDPKRRICVIERDLSQPDRIIGELLQPGGLAMLKQLGLLHCTEGIDSSIVKGYGVFLKGEQLNMHYPEDESGTRPTGRGMHYGRFVTNLRENLKEHSNVDVIEASVKKVMEKDGITYGVTYQGKDGAKHTLTSSLTVVANGAGSGFTKKISGTKPLSRSTFVGLRLKGGNAILPYPNHGNVFMADPGPVLAYPTSSEDVRVLVDFPKGTMPPMKKMADYLKDKIAPQLPHANLRQAFIDAVDEGDIRSVPNREMPSERVRKPGVLLLGDALTMRHPLTGSGMTAGLTDVYHITNALMKADFNNYDDVQSRLDKWWKNRNSSMATINILANALYAVFTPAVTPDPYVGLLQDAVFSYFKTGGVCVSGPVGLLGALIKNPYVLTSHYFAVALFTVREACKPFPTPWSLYASYRAIRCAVNIVFPLMAEERILRPVIPNGFFNRDHERYGQKTLQKLSQSA